MASRAEKSAANVQERAPGGVLYCDSKLKGALLEIISPLKIKSQFCSERNKTQFENGTTLPC